MGLPDIFTAFAGQEIRFAENCFPIVRRVRRSDRQPSQQTILQCADRLLRAAGVGLASSAADAKADSGQTAGGGGLVANMLRKKIATLTKDFRMETDKVERQRIADELAKAHDELLSSTRGRSSSRRTSGEDDDDTASAIRRAQGGDSGLVRGALENAVESATEDLRQAATPMAKQRLQRELEKATKELKEYRASR